MPGVMDELASGPGGTDANADPNLPAVRKARGQSAASAHYAEGSGYGDAMTKKEVDTGQKSGLHRKSSRSKKTARRGRR